MPAMPAIPTVAHVDSKICYFTIAPPYGCCNHQHVSSETPCFSPALFSHKEPSTPDPFNPLLTYRGPVDTALSRNMECLMQAQTGAAHGYSPNRPRPSLCQNVLHITSHDSSCSSHGSLNSSDGVSTPGAARCSRCQRTPSIDFKTGKTNMIQYGLNLWYCNRCANMVGLHQTVR